MTVEEIKAEKKGMWDRLFSKGELGVREWGDLAYALDSLIVDICDEMEEGKQ